MGSTLSGHRKYGDVLLGIRILNAILEDREFDSTAFLHHLLAPAFTEASIVLDRSAKYSRSMQCVLNHGTEVFGRLIHKNTTSNIPPPG